jgi:hypothetical protein
VSRLSSVDGPVKPNFREKFDELQRLIEADHIPIWVKTESVSLGQLTFKLFHRVYKSNPTFGTPKLLPDFHASNLLRELVQAYVALDWPRVIVLVHSASSNIEGHGSMGGTPMRAAT